MTVVRKLKDNLFLSAVVLAYAVLFIVNSRLGVAAVKSSGYYLKEMLLIMPVIFILTALLDLWVPKDKIMHYLGQEAGMKGVFFAFLIGSVSAGPVYAAFPMCVMLYRKGASIRNIVIILSSWAVIKIPMLLNEAKFLGLTFMAVRWLLTVLAMIILSWLTAKTVSRLDLGAEKDAQAGIRINRVACIGCALCVTIDLEQFVMKNGKAEVRPHRVTDSAKPEQAAAACPVMAITCLPAEQERD